MFNWMNDKRVNEAWSEIMINWMRDKVNQWET